MNSDDQIILTAEEAARQVSQSPYSKVLLVTEDLGMAAKTPQPLKAITLMEIPSTRDEIARILLHEDLLTASKAWAQHQGKFLA